MRIGGDSLMAEQLANQLGEGGSIPTSPLQFTVRQIPKGQTYDWLLRKHYAGRIPAIITDAFGLYDRLNLVGVLTYGVSGNRENNKIGVYDVRELNRLVINEGLAPNTCSYFIARTMREMPKPLFLMSYSDLNQSHHGYIYQATNWIYTGVSKGRDIFIDAVGQEWHEKTIWDRYKTNETNRLKQLGFTREQKLGKHRYFFILGKDKGQRKEMLGILMERYSILPYPKGDNQRYNASYEPTRQGVLI